jgi:hypothetical protein
VSPLILHHGVGGYYSLLGKKAIVVDNQAYHKDIHQERAVFFPFQASLCPWLRENR